MKDDVLALKEFIKKIYSKVGMSPRLRISSDKLGVWVGRYGRPAGIFADVNSYKMDKNFTKEYLLNVDDMLEKKYKEKFGDGIVTKELKRLLR